MRKQIVAAVEQFPIEITWIHLLVSFWQYSEESRRTLRTWLRIGTYLTRNAVSESLVTVPVVIVTCLPQLM